jgi:hypothetical protein
MSKHTPEITEADRKAIKDEIKKHNWQSILYVNTFRRGATWGILHARAEAEQQKVNQHLDNAIAGTDKMIARLDSERIKELEAIS